MNQKDYKEIAKIINIGVYGHYKNPEELWKKKYGSLIEHTFPALTVIVIRREEIVNELADYFERALKERYEACKKLGLSASRVDKCKFNRKQFLKDCGVE